MAGRRVRRRKELLIDLKEAGEYWKLQEELLARLLWRTLYGRDHGPPVRQTIERESE